MNGGTFKFTDSQAGNIEEKKIDIPAVDNTELRKQLVRRIEALTANIIEQICSGRLPKISYDVSRNYIPLDAEKPGENFDSQSAEDQDDTIREAILQNDPKRVTDFATRRGKDKFALMMSVMAAVHRLLITNTSVTRRSLYYDLKNERTANLVPEQRTLDQAVNHVASLLNCSPWDLNLLATSKGLVAGELSLTLADNRVIDCTIPGGALIPHIASNVISIRARARFVLVVEKDAVFQQFLEEGCISCLNCLLVTGKGYPDVATRMLVKLLAEKLDLPVYVIVDADPFGVDIMCVYRFGSGTLSRERESLACPKARWLGIHPSELLALGVRTAPLTEFDLSKLLALEGRPYMNDALLAELRIMRTGKAEIENVSSSSRKFFLATYLPCKIKGGDYI